MHKKVNNHKIGTISSKDYSQQLAKDLTPSLKTEVFDLIKKSDYKIFYYCMKSPKLAFFCFTSGNYSKQIAQKALTDYQNLFFENIDIIQLKNANKDLFLPLQNDFLLLEKYKNSVD